MAVALTTDERAALQRGAIAIRTLIDVHLDSGDGGRQSLWDGDSDLDYDGVTYRATPEDIISIGSISAGQDLGAEGVQVRVNGTRLRELNPDAGHPAALFGTITGLNYQMRRFDIRFAFFNSETGALIMVKRRFAGFISHMSQSEEIDESTGRAACWLTINLESIVLRYSNRAARTRSHDDQQEIWPGDTGCKFVASVAANSTLSWGRAPVGVAGGGGGAPGGLSRPRVSAV